MSDPIVTTSSAEMRKAQQSDKLRELQRAQQKAAGGDKNAIKEVAANRDKKARIKEHEKDLVHIKVLTRTIDNDSKTFHDERRVIKIQPRNIDQMIKDGAFAAYDEAIVIHDPRENAPKEYALKPSVVMPPSLSGPGNDAALAAREQQLKDRERRQEEAEARLDAKLAQLEQAGKAAKTETKTGDKLPPPPQV